MFISSVFSSYSSSSFRICSCSFSAYSLVFTSAVFSISSSILSSIFSVLAFTSAVFSMSSFILSSIFSAPTFILAVFSMSFSILSSIFFVLAFTSAVFSISSSILSSIFSAPAFTFILSSYSLNFLAAGSISSFTTNSGTALDSLFTVTTLLFHSVLSLPAYPERGTLNFSPLVATAAALNLSTERDVSAMLFSLNSHHISPIPNSSTGTSPSFATIGGFFVLSIIQQVYGPNSLLRF